MNTDELIQLFRLLDLSKLRKALEQMDDAERLALATFLQGCQR